jgi:acetyl-CoA synthetase
VLLPVGKRLWVQGMRRTRRIELTVELPKTSSGNIRRVELRDREQQRISTDRNPNEWWEEDVPR